MIDFNLESIQRKHNASLFFDNECNRGCPFFGTQAPCHKHARYLANLQASARAISGLRCVSDQCPLNLEQRIAVHLLISEHGGLPNLLLSGGAVLTCVKNV